jgi:retron-type reverse transcriptase
MWKPLPLREFWINDPKRRLISAPAYRDRVVHHALVQIIEPIFDRRFIHDTHACRVGHGTHYAVHRLQEYTRRAKRAWGGYYVYKGDIKSYFPSIYHETLKKIVRRTIGDKRILALIDLIIDGYRDGPRGLPIGALTSQLLANAYLDPLDHFAKDHLGVRFYMRYMDDFVCIVRNKSEARSVAHSLEKYIRDELSLEINPKSCIHHGKNGIAFCGFHIWPTHIIPRRSTVRRAARRLRKLTATSTAERVRASVMSFLGYFKHFSAHRSMQSILDRSVIKGGFK